MIDAHIHIDFYDRPEEVIKGIIEKRISTIFMTHLPELYEKQRQILGNIPEIFLAVGFHPILVNEYDFNEKLFIDSLKTTKFVGEVGLDYSVAKSETSRKKQLEIFEFICRNSKHHVMSIHSRNAEKEVLTVLKKYKVENAIFHWYTGAKELIPEIIDAGYYFSVNASMLRSTKGKGILKEIPLNRVLVESDGPFARYNKEIVEPQHMRAIYNAFETFYDENKLEDIIFENLLTIIG